jgi:hypothetical protein
MKILPRKFLETWSLNFLVIGELYLSTEACHPNWDDLPRRRDIWIIYNIYKEKGN